MISIIIVTCNSLKYIKACLDSVFSQKEQDWELICVDNGSVDGTREFIKNNYKRIKLIENDKNLGSSKARNQGIDLAVGKWVLTLDSDVVLKEDFIHEFCLLENDFGRDIGMTQPNILNIDAKTVYSQGIYLTMLRRFYDLGKGKPALFNHTGGRKITGPCSAAAFYRRSMLDMLKEGDGYFDPRFFFLVEDVDLAWRAQKKGWKTLFCPKAVCFHHGNGSATQNNIRQRLCFRNRHLMIAKNDSLWGKVLVYSFSLPYDFMRSIYFLFSHGR